MHVALIDHLQVSRLKKKKKTVTSSNHLNLASIGNNNYTEGSCRSSNAVAYLGFYKGGF